MEHKETIRDLDATKAEHTIRQALKEIRYGSIKITIHESKVVQIERKEKIRLERSLPVAPTPLRQP